MKTPIKIERIEGAGVKIKWNSGEENLLGFETLRTHCPCATCREKRGDSSHSKPITGGTSLLKVIEHTKDEELKLNQIRLIGNYAIGLDWADGHSTGIYTFQYLNELTERA
ncbi:MAG: DUF971 domain-containing protein [Deltaproteobacteria bacterium]|nr:DUF971 domain-containing protein [Deltaproteobacteria bacterium]